MKNAITSFKLSPFPAREPKEHDRNEHEERAGGGNLLHMAVPFLGGTEQGALCAEKLNIREYLLEQSRVFLLIPALAAAYRAASKTPITMNRVRHIFPKRHHTNMGHGLRSPPLGLRLSFCGMHFRLAAIHFHATLKCNFCGRTNRIFVGKTNIVFHHPHKNPFAAITKI